MKHTFEIHFRHKDNGGLENAFEKIETSLKKYAVEWGKAIAKERGWRFVSATQAT